MNGPHIQFFGTLTRDPEQCFSKDRRHPLRPALGVGTDPLRR